jgi:DNA repair protein RadC
MIRQVHPLHHQLLKILAVLEGVLLATAEQLCAVVGIGAATGACLLLSAAALGPLR